MKKAVTEQLGMAAYEARRQKLITGAYRNSAVRVPDAEHFYEWDAMPGDVEDAVKWLYRSQGEASVYAYFAYIAVNGSPKAKAALSVLSEETRALVYTDEEQAKMEGERYMSDE